jgi:hypothetical protein
MTIQTLATLATARAATLGRAPSIRTVRPAAQRLRTGHTGFTSACDADRPSDSEPIDRPLVPLSSVRAMARRGLRPTASQSYSALRALRTPRPSAVSILPAPCPQKVSPIAFRMTTALVAPGST